MSNATATEPKFHVGQEVIHIGHRGVRSTETISRVGRKYAYIQFGWREVPFSLETGVEKDYYNGQSRIATPEILEAEERLNVALDTLRGMGLEPVRYGGTKFTADQIEAVIAALGSES